MTLISTGCVSAETSGTAEALHEEARNLLLGPDSFVAPDILAAEFANAMRVKVIRGEIDQLRARRAVAAVSMKGEPTLRPSGPLIGRAFELAGELDHPVYDCVYLALAEDLGSRFGTVDQRFVAVASGKLAERIHLLGSCSNPTVSSRPTPPAHTVTAGPSRRA